MVDSSETLGPRAGDVLGRYQLLIPIAKGGMGQVWVARLTGTRGFQKLVALKTILPSTEDVANLESMLFDEASLASQIHHPNVAETLDLGEQDGTLFLVMEWVYGEPLDRVVKAARAAGGIPLPIAVDLIAQGCRGLHAAHGATDSRGEPLGIVHRDVSPQNLLVTYRGVVKLVDFGVAKATQQMSRPTTTGEVKGKFAYMAPEQVHGEKLDARADVFAMGIVLYWLTTGEHPFRADNAAATLRNIMVARPALPSSIVPAYPPLLEAVTMKALARDKAERYGTAHEMMLALEAAVPRTSAERAETELQAFMEQIFAERLRDRTMALEASLQAADAGLAIASARPRPHLPVSQSTMRAVSVENAPAIFASETPSAEPSTPAATPRARKVAPLAIALVAGLLLAAVAYRVRNEHVSATARSPLVELRAAASPRPSPSSESSEPVTFAGPEAKTPAAQDAAVASALAPALVPAPLAGASIVQHLAPAKRRDHASKPDAPVGPPTLTPGEPASQSLRNPLDRRR